MNQSNTTPWVLEGGLIVGGRDRNGFKKQNLRKFLKSLKEPHDS
jgi:hypothetical protein